MVVMATWLSRGPYRNKRCVASTYVGANTWQRGFALRTTSALEETGQQERHGFCHRGGRTAQRARIDARFRGASTLATRAVVAAGTISACLMAFRWRGRFVSRNLREWLDGSSVDTCTSLVAGTENLNTGTSWRFPSEDCCFRVSPFTTKTGFVTITGWRTWSCGLLPNLLGSASRTCLSGQERSLLGMDKTGNTGWTAVL